MVRTKSYTEGTQGQRGFARSIALTLVQSNVLPKDPPENRIAQETKRRAEGLRGHGAEAHKLLHASSSVHFADNRFPDFRCQPPYALLGLTQGSHTGSESRRSVFCHSKWPCE